MHAGDMSNPSNEAPGAAEMSIHNGLQDPFTTPLSAETEQVLNDSGSAPDLSVSIATDSATQDLQSYALEPHALESHEELGEEDLIDYSEEDEDDVEGAHAADCSSGSSTIQGDTVQPVASEFDPVVFLDDEKLIDWSSDDHQVVRPLVYGKSTGGKGPATWYRERVYPAKQEQDLVHEAAEDQNQDEDDSTDEETMEAGPEQIATPASLPQAVSDSPVERDNGATNRESSANHKLDEQQEQYDGEHTEEWDDFLTNDDHTGQEDEYDNAGLGGESFDDTAEWTHNDQQEQLEDPKQPADQSLGNPADDGSESAQSLPVQDHSHSFEGDLDEIQYDDDDEQPGLEAPNAVAPQPSANSPLSKRSWEEHNDGDEGEENDQGMLRRDDTGNVIAHSMTEAKRVRSE